LRVATTIGNIQYSKGNMNTKINNIETCLNDYFDYHHSILLPTFRELENKISNNVLRLHNAIGFNMIIAHALDYLLAIEMVRGSNSSRKKLMIKLDEGYSNNGGYFSNGKFQLVDAVNNSIKHINLDGKRYSRLIKKYGDMSFRLLYEKDGIVYFKSQNYQFDYGRVVLRGISNILNFTYDEPEIILGTLDCLPTIYCLPDYLDSSDTSTAIDRMIDYCNPICLDCREGEDECNCDMFIYGKKAGDFNSDIDHSFNLELTLSEIGNSWD